MHKKIFLTLTTLAVLAGVNGYAQKKQFVKQTLESLTGSVPGRISKMVPVSTHGVDLLGARLAAAQVMMADSKFISSADLFNCVKATRVFEGVPAHELRTLEDKFAKLDVTVLEHPRYDYNLALWKLGPASSPQVLGHPQVFSMTELLNIQQYMQSNGGQFPHVYSIREGGWLITTDCLNTPAGNRAFLGVVSILVKEQAGEVSQAIVDQLVALHAGAVNPVSMREVVNQLKTWQEISPSHAAPKLPVSLEGVSLRTNAEGLWLAAEIRLLQLTPGLELPEILKTAQVTQ